MELWTVWLDTVRGLLLFLSSDVGIGAGWAVVAATVLLRLGVLPISWPLAHRARLRQRKLRELQPELARIRASTRDRPELYAQRVLALYRRHGLSPIDGKGVLGALAQLPIFLGMYHVLREGFAASRFLWISNLARPDALMAVIAGVTTALMMAAMPELPEHVRAIMLILPAVIMALIAFKLASAVCLYWATSNCFSAAQTVALRLAIERRDRAGRSKVA